MGRRVLVERPGGEIDQILAGKADVAQFIFRQARQLRQRAAGRDDARRPEQRAQGGRAERGSITGLYTVLVEGDDLNEPIADTTRSILDGHIRLSRSLAESSHYPSVDVLESISRVAPAIAPPEVLQAGARLRELLAAWRDARDLIEIDAYVPGTNPLVDRAVKLRPAIDAFLKQPVGEISSLASTTEDLLNLVALEDATT